ncbi:MAG: hypothetical protein JWN00_4735 [Actinomycetia bacterium]|nr:hypothetical protein [Actinomycetes bacterium]
MTSLRTLPVPLARLPAELLGSYLNRLADANHITVRELSHLLGPGRFHARDSDDLTGWTLGSTVILAALTGRQVIELRYAIPALHDAPDEPPNPPPDADSTIDFWRCPACLLYAASRGVRRLAIQHTHPHERICATHGRWRGGGDQRPLRHLLPEALHANRRHRRLLRRHDLLQLSRDHHHAQELTARWLTDHDGPPELRQLWTERLQRLGEDPYGDPHRPSPDRIELVTYPETVTLTSLIGSNHNDAAERLTSSRASLIGTGQSHEDRADLLNPARPPLTG